MRLCKTFRLIGIGFGLFLLAFAPAQAEPLAKELFGGKKLSAATAPAVHGFYSKGCFSGGVALAPDGPHWQAMRLSRNRHWGHPELIRLVERLSREAARDGWPGLLVGDISQPRGGPMLTGHASHQVGLDADIWFTPMPDRRMSVAEREKVSAVSMLKEGTLHVDDRKWTPAHEAVLRRAANYSQVERIFVHPGIKKKLCDTVRGDRSWLGKIRPFWGHHYHFHIRIACPDGSSNCRSQAAPPAGTGCDESLAWWFTEEPWKPSDEPDKPKARDIMTMDALPNACRAVLEAPAPISRAAVTVSGQGDLPRPAAARATVADPSSLLPSLQPEDIPLPKPRPN